MLWVIGGVIALAGALTYAELGTTFPRSGGEYHLLSRLMHPSIGFAAGIVSSTVGFTAPAVLAAMALGSYLNLAFTTINPNVIACIVIILTHLLHMSSIKWGATSDFVNEYRTIIDKLDFKNFISLLCDYKSDVIGLCRGSTPENINELTKLINKSK